MKKKILVSIVNHNNNDNAIKLRDLFKKDFEVVVIDSGSSVKDSSFILLDNVYYSGLFNRSVEEAINRKKEWMFLICSDVQISEDEYSKIYSRLENEIDFNDIWVYSPSSRGKSHHFCKNHGSGKMRDVPMIEGFIFMAKVDLLQRMFPVDLATNNLGWGLDVMKGVLCKSLGKRCVIDDEVTVYHPEGTGYATNHANDQMNKYLEINGIDFEKYRKILGI